MALSENRVPSIWRLSSEGREVAAMADFDQASSIRDQGLERKEYYG
jgi:hypothetical protein